MMINNKAEEPNRIKIIIESRVLSKKELEEEVLRQLDAGWLIPVKDIELTVCIG